MKQIKIKSDGSIYGTEVTVDGELVEGVQRIEYVIDVDGARSFLGPVGRAVIHVLCPIELDLPEDRVETRRRAPQEEEA